MSAESPPVVQQLDGNAEYDAALEALIAATTHTLRVFDKSIGRNFSTPQRYESLRRVLLGQPRNRVFIVLHETANITRDCPRLMMLIKQFSHCLFVHQTLPAARAVYDPFAIADNQRFVHKFHHSQPRAVAVTGDLLTTQLLLNRFEEIWAASAPAIAATTLGL